jgi:hypothetical protein
VRSVVKTEKKSSDFTDVENIRNSIADLKRVISEINELDGRPVRTQALPARSKLRQQPGIGSLLKQPEDAERSPV